MFCHHQHSTTSIDPSNQFLLLKWQIKAQERNFLLFENFFVNFSECQLSVKQRGTFPQGVFVQNAAHCWFSQKPHIDQNIFERKAPYPLYLCICTTEYRFCTETPHIGSTTPNTLLRTDLFVQRPIISIWKEFHKSKSYQIWICIEKSLSKDLYSASQHAAIWRMGHLSLSTLKPDTW